MATRTSNSIQVGSIAVDFLVEAQDSNGSVTVFECTVPAGAKVPAQHSHDGFEETIYGLQGTCIFVLDDQEHEIGPGDSVCVRRGQVHGFDIQFMGSIAQIELRQNNRSRAKGIGFDDIGASLKVGAMDAKNQFRTGDNQYLGAVLTAKEICLDGEGHLMNHRAHRAVDDKNTS